MRTERADLVDSGVSWIGKVPPQWTMKPLWSMFERVKDVDHPDEQMLSVFREFGVVAKESRDNINKTAENRSIYQLVHPGWLVANRMKAWQGSVGISSLRGIVSGHYICFAPRHGEDSRYLNWLLRSTTYTNGYALLSRGVRIGQAEIDNDEFRLMPVLLPSRGEQRAIADYLDRETARIDTLIEEQQRLIEMLGERRFALRTHVALHGTASAEEIESPLPWALMLPAHWRVVPLTSVADLESGHTPSRSREDWWADCYIPWVSLHDVGTMRGTKFVQDTAQHISDAGIANSSARLLPARTVVLSRDATVGRTAIMGIPMATSQHFAAWVCGPLLDPEYLWVLFQDAMQPFFDSFQNGSTIRTIGMGDLKAFRIPLPPLDEQRRIVAYLDDETAKIDALIAETERFIELRRSGGRR